MSQLKEFITNNGRPYLIGHGVVDVSVNVKDMRTKTQDGTTFVFDHKGIILEMNNKKQTWQHPTLFLSIKEAMTFLSTLKDESQKRIVPLQSILEIGKAKHPYMFLGIYKGERLFLSLVNDSVKCYELAVVTDLKIVETIKLPAKNSSIKPVFGRSTKYYNEALNELKTWCEKQPDLLTAVNNKKKLYAASLGYASFTEDKQGYLVANIKNKKNSFTIELICDKNGYESMNDVDDKSLHKTVFHDQKSLIRYNTLLDDVNKCLLKPLETRLKVIDIDEDFEDDNYLANEILLFLGTYQGNKLFFSETQQTLKLLDFGWYDYDLLQPNLSLREKGIIL